MSTIRWLDPSWSKEGKEDFESLLKSSRLVLDRLSEIIKEDIELSLRKQRDEGNFSKPAWSEYQAYLLGEQKALNKLLSIINLKDK